MPGYQKVQFIGHAINTGCKPLKNGEYDYVGLEVPKDDVAERIKLVKAVLNLAKGHAKVQQNNKDVLKVLVLPEFFFRGKVGAYLLGTPETVALISELQKAVKDADWANWFFVFGTALGMSALTSADIEKTIAKESQDAKAAKKPYDEAARRKELSKFTAYNFALCQGGGFGDGKDAGPNNAHAVTKELKSRIDFIHDSVKDPNFWLKGRYGLLHEQVEHMPAANVTQSEVQSKSYGGEGIFTHDGFKWGVEICLDHLSGRLAASNPLPSDIKLQVVPSCGASIDGNHIVVKNGYVFNCDGLNRAGRKPTAANDAHTELQKVNGATRTPVDPVATVTLAGQVNAVQVDKIFAAGPGELHIYDALPLNVT